LVRVRFVDVFSTQYLLIEDDLLSWMTFLSSEDKGVFLYRFLNHSVQGLKKCHTLYDILLLKFIEMAYHVYNPAPPYKNLLEYIRI
jgi:hypothetical protein